MTDRSTWKKFEGRVAAYFHCRRAPLSGVNGGVTRSDTLHEHLFLECKLRERSAIFSLFEETAARARLENKTPVLALGHKGHEGFLLVVHCGDLHEVTAFARDIETLPEVKQ